MQDADRRADAVPTSRAELEPRAPTHEGLLAARLEHAYAVGDHRDARALASRLLDAHDAALAARARDILAYTAPDPFLAWVGAAGLGLVAWLVYNFMS